MRDERREVRRPAGVVAVTGTSGHVGAAVAAALDAAGWTVRGIDRAAGRRTTDVGDLRDRRVRCAALRTAEVVVHAAALHAPHVGVVGDAEFRAVNVARCFPEPLPVLATRLLHRSVGLPDVAAATVLAAEQSTANGTFNIAGRYPFVREDCRALHHDAAA